MAKIEIENVVEAPLKKAWEHYTDPKHIVNWNAASEDWHCPEAENDIRTGGKFRSRMEAKDGSMGFDFEGIYDEVIPHQLIAYTMEDGRKVETTFDENNGKTIIKTIFDPENQNSIEMQKQGWQAILDNFKKYVEK